MSWRKALAASLVLALCAGLAGCGIRKAEPELTAESYTVTDAFGTEVTIPAKPERIAADSEFLDEMLLSVVPHLLEESRRFLHRGRDERH